MSDHTYEQCIHEPSWARLKCLYPDTAKNNTGIKRTSAEGLLAFRATMYPMRYPIADAQARWPIFTSNEVRIFLLALDPESNISLSCREFSTMDSPK